MSFQISRPQRARTVRARHGHGALNRSVSSWSAAPGTSAERPVAVRGYFSPPHVCQRTSTGRPLDIRWTQGGLSAVTWLKVEQSLLEHRKTYALADSLGIDPLYAAAHMIALWLWALDYVGPDGCLLGLSDRSIARAARWPGEAEQFVTAAREAGFLDAVEDGLRIHDWADYAGKLVERRQRDAQRKREERAGSCSRSFGGRPQDVRRTSEGRQEDFHRKSHDHPPDNQRTTERHPTDENARVQPALNERGGRAWNCDQNAPLQDVPETRPPDRTLPSSSPNDTEPEDVSAGRPLDVRWTSAPKSKSKTKSLYTTTTSNTETAVSRAAGASPGGMAAVVVEINDNELSDYVSDEAAPFMRDIEQACFTAFGSLPAGLATCIAECLDHGMQPEVVIHAVQQAAAGRRTWNWAASVLRRYQAQGVLTLEAVEADDRAWRARKSRREEPEEDQQITFILAPD